MSAEVHWFYFFASLNENGAGVGINETGPSSTYQFKRLEGLAALTLINLLT